MEKLVLLATLLPLFGIFFEGPIGAAAIAGGAVSVPIIIHLLNRRRFKVVTWAAMRFLLAAQKKNSRRMRLEQLLLLAVRCLLLLLLAFAMFAVTPWANAHLWNKLPGSVRQQFAQNGQRAHRILVLDGSFSMAFRGDGEKTNFERACACAADFVRNSPRGDAFSVVLMSSAGRLVVPEPSENVEKVVAEIEKLRQPHTGADLGSTFTSVGTIVKESPPKYTHKEVFFFTDLQHSTWIAQQSTSLNALLQSFKDQKVTSVLVDVGENLGENGAANLAVTGVSLLDDVATTERPTPILFTLHNYGAETRENIAVKFFVARGGADEQGKFQLGAAKEERSKVTAAAGQDTLVTFSYHFDRPGDYVVQLQVENDGLRLDDVRSAVIRVRKDTPVLLVNGRPYGDRLDQATEWLRVSLNPFEEGQPTPADVTVRPKVITPADLVDQTRGDLTPYDCVYLCDVPAYDDRTAAALASRLETFVRRGAAWSSALANRSTRRHTTAGSTATERACCRRRSSGLRTADPGYRFKFHLDDGWSLEPPLKAFAGASDQISLLAPYFHHYYEFGEVKSVVKPRRVLGMTEEVIPGKEGETRSRRDWPFMLEWQPPLPAAGKGSRKAVPSAFRTRGRVVLIAGPVNAEWGNWPATHGFPALMQELVNFAAAGRLRERTVDAGRPIELFLNTPARGVEAVVYTPDGRQEKPTVTDLDEGCHVRFADTEISGVYRIVVTVGGKSEEHLFAVNVPVRNDDRISTECDLKRTTKDELAQAYPALGDIQRVTDPQRYKPRPADDVAATLPVGADAADGETADEPDDARSAPQSRPGC